MNRGRIGVLGGTFDPIHVGHLIAAERVREELCLDRVIFVPAARPPHKEGAGITDSEHRLAMVRKAAEGNPAFEVSDLELQRRGRSYTIETVHELKARWGPDAEIFFLMGGDSLLEITMWKDYHSLLNECTVVVFPRPGQDVSRVDSEIRRRIRVVCTPEVDVASRDIRRRVRDGKSVRYLIPASVESYIRAHGLYQ